MDTLEALSRKISSAKQLKSVVRTMKALAGSNIGQFESSLKSLEDYYHTVVLGLAAHLKENKAESLFYGSHFERKGAKILCAIVFGSDQGLVGQFNEALLSFVLESTNKNSSEKEFWAVGERIEMAYANVGIVPDQTFYIPNSLNAIAPLVGKILTSIEGSLETNENREVYIFYNQPKSRTSYVQVGKRILPLDEKWRKEISLENWPTKTNPQKIGEENKMIKALLNEYFFATLFKACAESLASENASRLIAMQRAEKNIEETLNDFNRKYHQIRQTSIDEELFDVISGFEALNGDNM